MSKVRKNPSKTGVDDTERQRQLHNEPTEFDHEFANEPLTAMERANNKRRKKNQ